MSSGTKTWSFLQKYLTANNHNINIKEKTSALALSYVCSPINLDLDGSAVLVITEKYKDRQDEGLRFSWPLISKNTVLSFQKLAQYSLMG